MSAALAAVAFTAPETNVSHTTASYQQHGRFSYSARTKKGTVYPDGRFRTGDPAFLRLADALEVDFDYRLRSKAPRAARGTARLTAQLTEASGWTRTLQLQPSTEFSGDHTSLHGKISLDRLEMLVRRFRTETGVMGSAVVLAIEPYVQIGGLLAGQRLHDDFAPRLTFTLDGESLTPQLTQPGRSGAGSGPLTPSAPGNVELTHTQPGRLSLAGLELPVVIARRIAPVTAGVSLLLLLVGALLHLRTRGAGEVERIHSRYRHLLVPVARSDRRSYDEVIEVTSIDTLVRLAERYDRMILHEQSRLGHSYRIADDGVLYVFRVDHVDSSRPAGFGATTSDPTEKCASIAAARPS